MFNLIIMFNYYKYNNVNTATILWNEPLCICNCYGIKNNKILCNSMYTLRCYII